MSRGRDGSPVADRAKAVRGRREQLQLAGRHSGDHARPAGRRAAHGGRVGRYRRPGSRCGAVRADRGHLPERLRRPMCRFLFPVAALLGSVAAVRADPPTADQIQAWIRDLDNSSFKTRDQAMHGLRRAGPDAAAPLAKAARNGSTEVADRALRLLGEMADGSDAKAEAAARRHLHRLADSESNVAGEARSILNRKRNRLLLQLTFAGASYRESRDGLTYLDLDDVTDLDSVLPVLKFFPEIEELSISNKRFTDASATHLTELPNLRDLNLYRSNIGDEGLKHLTGLKNLRRIPMGETRVTDQGLKIIGGMTQLEYVG